MEKTFDIHSLWLILANLNQFRNIPGLTFKYIYRSRVLMEKLLPEVKPYEEIRGQMIKKYVVTDPQGRPQIENGNLVFNNPEDQQKMAEELEPIARELITITFRPLRIEMADFGDKQINTQLFDMISPLCEVIDEEQVEDKPPLQIVGIEGK